MFGSSVRYQQTIFVLINPQYCMYITRDLADVWLEGQTISVWRIVMYQFVHSVEVIQKEKKKMNLWAGDRYYFYCKGSCLVRDWTADQYFEIQFFCQIFWSAITMAHESSFSLFPQRILAYTLVYAYWRQKAPRFSILNFPLTSFH